MKVVKKYGSQHPFPNVSQVMTQMIGAPATGHWSVTGERQLCRFYQFLTIQEKGIHQLIMLLAKIDLSYKMSTFLAFHCPPYSYRLIRLWLFECKTILRSVKNAHQSVCNDLMVGKCDTIVGKLLAKLVDQKEGGSRVQERRVFG